MKKQFAHYYRLSDDDFSRLWTAGILAVDASVLLDIYRYSDETVKDLLDNLRRLGSRLWTPHQAAFEYHENLESVIAGQVKPYDEAKRQVQALVSVLSSKSRHPFVPHAVLQEFSDVAGRLEIELTEGRSRLESLLSENMLKEQVAAIFADKVGESFSTEDMKAVIESGPERYKRKCPPGYLDGEKLESERYGDLIIWHQLMVEAKRRGRPLLFISADIKEDWFLRIGGKTLGPRPELIEEFTRITGQLYYSYTTQLFLEYAPKYLGTTVRPETLKEIESRGRADIVTRIQAGDYEALGPLYLEYAPQLRRIAQTRLSNPDEADDIVQSLFVSLPEIIHKVEPGRDLGLWLKRQTRSLVRQRLRQKSERLNQAKGHSVFVEERPELRRATLGAIRDLQALGHNDEEIARLLGLSRFEFGVALNEMTRLRKLHEDRERSDSRD